jgi:putative glutamine amidotransferase
VAPRPLIGISTSELRPAEGAHFAHQSEPPRRMLALGVAYLEAVQAAGGMPLVMAPMPTRTVEELLDRVDGVCLSGGPDLEPSWYGANAHPELGPTEPEVDVFELSLARAARRRGLPVLAICRGLQVLNVSRGGTLVQHLPETVGTQVAHRQATPASDPTHVVQIQAGSRLGKLMDDERPQVNSFHHQAVDRLGAGLQAVAWAEDGVVEGLEAPGDFFTVGVQWHAECLTARPEHAALFSGLVDAAKQHARLALERAA